MSPDSLLRGRGLSRLVDYVTPRHGARLETAGEVTRVLRPTPVGVLVGGRGRRWGVVGWLLG